MIWIVLLILFLVVWVLDFRFNAIIDNFIKGFGDWFFNKRSQWDKLFCIYLWIVSNGLWFWVTFIHYLIWRRGNK